jgi:hypothetical protein
MGLIIYVGILELSPQIQVSSTSETIPDTEPIKAFEDVPIEALNTTKRMESMTFLELRWRSLTEDKQNFWQASGVFIVLISSVIPLLLRKCWHRKDGTKDKMKQLQTILELDGNLAQQLGAAMVQDGHRDQFQDEMESLKEPFKATERLYAQFQNAIDLSKMIKEEVKRRSQIREEIKSMAVAIETAFDAYGTDGQRSNIHEAPCPDEDN